MSSETCEVPIMLDIHGLTYEDIAKLNPFYEEYKAFWDDPRGASDSSLCPDSLSSSSSLPSIAYSAEPSSPPFDMATSLSFHIPVYPDSPLSKSPEITIHNGGQCRPIYDEHHDLESSQIAIVEFDGSIRRPLSPVRECTAYEVEVMSLDPVDHALGRVRSSHKQLFGANGWLGCTAEFGAPSSSKAKYKSLIGFGKKFKQHVEEIAGDVVKVSSIPFTPRQPKVLPKATVAISMDRTAQAKLYSEMEVMICISANRFLFEQYNHGRLSKESIRKVNNFWGAKNRPEVVEFQFDQATQRQLILSNIRTLYFSGESSTNPVLLNSNLQNWKAVVKEMSIRTFCAPDSVIRKHMHDIQKLLDMLGAPIATFLAFEELQMRTLLLMKEQRARSYLAEGGCTMLSRSSHSS
ncbi:hypothetical protein BDW59DRAFT_175266 [Aspergillus cavernicola]|uniref:Uncharacterized protein n=1 Tax=Aspergillus cavernicola TaxID=176166 RepID=A0ABR4HRS8_9EURO